MDKVIPKAGHTWVNNATKKEWRVNSATGDVVSIETPNVGCTMAINALRDNYTFKPSNDLEWLACNAKWVDGIKYVFKQGNLARFTDTQTTHCECFDEQQHRDVQYELFGLQDKPVNKVNMITEYVKCDFAMPLDAFVEFYKSPRKLHSKSVSENKEIKYEQLSLQALARLVDYGKDIYLEVERPITWQEAVCDFANNLPQTFCQIVTHTDSLEGRKAGFDFKECWLSDDEVKSLAKLITSLTKGE